MESVGKGRLIHKVRIYSADLYVIFISEKKDGSQIKYEGFRFTTYFVSVKISIECLDDIKM